MISALAFGLREPCERERVMETLQEQPTASYFVLDTCQRLEVYSADGELLQKLQVLEDLVAEKHTGRSAFLRLARIATGIDSRVVGELEILGQVRRAYRESLERSGRGPSAEWMEAVLTLARKARRESKIDQRMTSLGGLASRHLLDLVPKGEPLAVIGSGSLAKTCVRYLSKRGTSSVRIASRCPDNAMQLAVQYGGFGAGLDDLAKFLNGASGIICATAAPHPILYSRHLESAGKDARVVDLGVPADCSEEAQKRLRERYVSLQEIEAKSMANQEQRMASAEIAKSLLEEEVNCWWENAAIGKLSGKMSGEISARSPATRIA